MSSKLLLMIKLTNLLPQSNTKVYKLHLAATVFFLALFVFPLYPLRHLTNVILIVFSALTMIAYLLNPVPIKKTIFKNLVFILPFLPYLIEVFITGFDHTARFEFEKKLFFFTAVFFIPVFFKVTGFKNYKLALLIFAMLISALSLYAFTALFISGVPFSTLAYENGSYILRHSFERIAGLHPTYYSIFALTSACFLVFADLKIEKRWRTISYIMAVLLLTGVVFLAVRIAFVALGVFFLVWIAEKKITLWQKLLLCLTTLILSMATMFVVPSLNNRLSEFTGIEDGSTNNANTISQRTMIMNCSWKIFTDKLLTGTGSSHFQKDLSDCYTSNNWPEGAKLNFNPHNQYLSIGINYGIIMMIVFIACLFVIFRKVFKFSEGKYFGIAIILFFLTESLLERELGVYFFGLIALLLYNMEPEKLLSDSMM